MMNPQRTALRAYDLATWGGCGSVEEIKRKLGQERLWPELVDDAFAKELETLIRDRKQRDAA
jgi:hypothetical protein